MGSGLSLKPDLVYRPIQASFSNQSAIIFRKLCFVGKCGLGNDNRMSCYPLERLLEKCLCEVNAHHRSFSLLLSVHQLVYILASHLVWLSPPFHILRHLVPEHMVKTLSALWTFLSIGMKTAKQRTQGNTVLKFSIVIQWLTICDLMHNFVSSHWSAFDSSSWIAQIFILKFPTWIQPASNIKYFQLVLHWIPSAFF